MVLTACLVFCAVFGLAHATSCVGDCPVRNTPDDEVSFFQKDVEMKARGSEKIADKESTDDPTCDKTKCEEKYTLLARTYQGNSTTGYSSNSNKAWQEICQATGEDVDCSGCKKCEAVFPIHCNPVYCGRKVNEIGGNEKTAWDAVCKAEVHCHSCKKCDKHKSYQDPIRGVLKMEHFKDSTGGKIGCYHRGVRRQTMVVDMHYHDRPFGLQPIKFADQMSWMKEGGVLFVVLNGIGQKLPPAGNCEYYMDCNDDPKPGFEHMTARPSYVNDVWNAQSYLDWKDRLDAQGAKEADRVAGQEVIVSMTYGDLTKPETLVPHFDFLEEQFPGLFNWVGELNVVKQALQGNDAGFAPTPQNIKDWATWMGKIRAAKIPISFHMDVGNNKKNHEFLPVMDQILKTYAKDEKEGCNQPLPVTVDNKERATFDCGNIIVWLHLAGLSKELDFDSGYTMEKHANMIDERLTKYPNLYIDLSWNVLFDNVFFGKAGEKNGNEFIALMEKHPTRFLPGTDFVASYKKTNDVYLSQVYQTSYFAKFLQNEAFRRIVLGNNFFDLVKHRNPERFKDLNAPPICAPDVHFSTPDSQVKKREHD